MKKLLLAITLVLTGELAHAQQIVVGNGNAAQASGAFTAGDLIVGSGPTALKDTLAFGANGGISLSGGGVPTFLVGGLPCFWSDVHSCVPENIRGRERALFGNAVLMTDASATCCSATWLGTNSTAVAPIYLARDAQTLSMSDVGAVALSGMTRSSDGGTNGRAPIGVGGYALLNPSGISGEQIKAYGGYFQCDNREITITTGVCYGAELDAVNYGPNQTGDAYGPGFGSFGLWLGAGGSQSPTNPSNAVFATAANGTTWNEGFILADGSLTKDGNGNSVAMSMGQGATLTWMVSGGVVGSQIRGSVSTANDSIRQLFTNNQVEWDGTNGTAIFTAQHVGNGINGLLANDAVTGSPPILRPSGTDTNIGVDIRSKAAGAIRFYPGIDVAGAFVVENAALTKTYISVDTSGNNVSLPQVTTGTPAASLCLDASNNIIKKTTTGSCT